MRRARSNNKQKGPSLRAQAADALSKFFWRTLVPLTPIFIVFYALMFLHNRDVTGEYIGSSPVTGAVNLVIEQTEGNRLTGHILLKQQYKMKIKAGFINDDRINLSFVFPGRTNITPTFAGSHFAGPVSGINMVGNVSQGDYIEGTFFNGADNIQLKLKRNTATSLFKKFWFRF